SRVQAEFLSGRDQFLEQILDRRSQAGQVTGCGAVFREPIIRPEVTENLDEMRLAAAVKATDPDSGLLRFVEVFQEGFEDADQPPLVLAFADERLQLEAQRAALFRIFDVCNLGDTVIEQVEGAGVFEENFPIFHSRLAPWYGVMGIAR